MTRFEKRGTQDVMAGLVAMLLSIGTAAAAGPDLRLLEAIKQGNRAVVRALLKAGVDANVSAGDGSSALHLAIARNDRETAQMLIRSGAAVNAVNDLSVTPLWLSSSIGNEGILTDLLQAGADPNIGNSTGVTPLMMAARSGQLALVKTLVGRGANPNAKESTRLQTALMWAVVNHHADVARALIDAGADVHARSKVWQQYVLACCQDFQNDPGMAMVVNLGGYTPLMYAAQQGDVECARALLAAGAKMEDRAPDGTTALVIAALVGRVPFVTFLLDHGANADADAGGYSALHVGVLRAGSNTLDGERLASQPDDTALVKVLLAHKANLNGRLTKPTFFRYATGDYAFDKRWLGATPFWLAAAFRDVELMKTLADAGADVKLPANDGTTPLIAAIGAAKTIDWQPETRRAIWQRGVIALPAPDVEATILEAAKLLVSWGIDVNAKNDKGDTALLRAAAVRHVNVVKFLAERGGRVNVRNVKGESPLSVALAAHPFPFGPTEDEITQKSLVVIDARREELVAVLRGLGAKE